MHSCVCHFIEHTATLTEAYGRSSVTHVRTDPIAMSFILRIEYKVTEKIFINMNLCVYI